MISIGSRMQRSVLTYRQVRPSCEDLCGRHVTGGEHGRAGVDGRYFAMDTGTDISFRAYQSGKGTVRWISRSEVGASAYDFVACMVYNDGAVGREGAGATLFIQGFVGLSSIRKASNKAHSAYEDILVACTSHEYYMVCR